MAEQERPALFLLIGEGKASESGLRRIPVSMVVTGFKGKQKFAMTKDDLAAVVTNFRKRKTGDLVIDYDHSTLSAGDGEPKPAAGWLKQIDDAPDEQGVLWGDAEFTERAAKMLDAREYKYVSPVTDWGVRDKETGNQQGATLTSVALTNSPLFEGMPALPLVASDDAGWQFDRGDVVEERREKKTVKILRVVLAAVAAGKVRLVADDNTESEHVIEGLKVVSMADVGRGSDGKWDFSKIPHDNHTLVASDVLCAMDVQTEINAAVKAGKILPAQREFYEKSALADLAGFRTLVASMKPAVDLEEYGTGAEGVKLNTLAAVQGAIDAKVAEKQKALPQTKYGQALKLVASENPELMQRRNELQRRRAQEGN
jgi:phage I-like protein